MVARKFEKHVILTEGCPVLVISDEGTEYKKEFATLLESYGVRHNTSLPYHHQANGQVERFMQSINKVVRIVGLEDVRSWPKRLRELALAYNMAYHHTTRNTPFFLSNFRDPRLAVDNRLQLPDAACIVERCAEQRLKVIKEAARNTAEMTRGVKERYDAKHRDTQVQIGDLVLVKDGAEIKPKHLPLWSNPYRVVGTEEGGLRLSVRPLYGGPVVAVSLQRVKPYKPMDDGEPEVVTAEPMTSKVSTNQGEITVDEPLSWNNAGRLEESSDSEDDGVGQTLLDLSKLSGMHSSTTAAGICTGSEGSKRRRVDETNRSSSPTHLESETSMTLPSNSSEQPIQQADLNSNKVLLPIGRAEGDGVENRSERVIDVESPESLGDQRAEVGQGLSTPQSRESVETVEPGPLFNSPGGGQYYEVEDILQQRYYKKRGQYLYKVKWRGYEKPQWVWDNAIVSPDLVENYHKRKGLPPPRRPNSNDESGRGPQI